MTKSDGKKECQMCGKRKPLAQFYRSGNEKKFPDKRFHTCSVCVRELVGEDITPKLDAFLEDIDKPFLREVWIDASNRKNNTLGEYLRLLNSSNLYIQLRYIDSDTKIKGRSMTFETRPHVIDKNKSMIVLDEELEKKWHRYNPTYEGTDILSMELYCRNMKYDYEIDTTAKEVMLEELAMLNLRKTDLLKRGNYQDYERISRVYKSTMQDAGFRPVDRKNNLDKTGIDSIAQIVAQIETDSGFIPPNRISYEPDDIDMMLAYYVQWAQRFNDRAVDVGAIENWRDSVDAETIKEQFEVDSVANEEDYKEEEPEEEFKEVVINADD